MYVLFDLNDGNESCLFQEALCDHYWGEGKQTGISSQSMPARLCLFWLELSPSVPLAFSFPKMTVCSGNSKNVQPVV